MATQFQQFEALTDALESGNYNRMAKAAKAVGIFSGQAPNKGDLTAKIEDFLNANVSIDSTPVLPEPVANALLDIEITERDSVPFPVPDNSRAGAESDNSPKPTGKGGGNGEFYWWPEQKVYSTMYNGQPREEDQFSAEEWAVFGKRLPDFTDLKPAVVKAAKKAAEPTVYKYTVTVNFNGITFESTDPELAASELSAGTLLQMLDDIGVTCDTEVTFNVTKGKAKKSGGSRNKGEGSGFYTATQKDELRPLNTVQKQILQAAASIDGCPLSDYAKYGRQDSVKLGNVCIEFKKKGYGDAIKRVNGAIHFDPGAMYEGYELSHSLS